MARVARTATIGIAAGAVEMPTDGGRVKATNLHATQAVWINLTGTGVAVVEADDCIILLPNSSVILPGSGTYSMIATGAGTKVVLEAALGRI